MSARTRAPRRSALAAASFVALLAFTAFGALAPRASAADGGSVDAARRGAVAVRIGSRAVTVGELEDHLASMPPFQAATLGATRDEIVRAYVDQVIVRDLLLGAGAEQHKLDTTLPTKHQLERAKSTATLRAVRAAFRSPAAIPMADVEKYYADNRSRFDSPERVNLWRILCKTREEANAVITAAKRELTITKFSDLAREHSIDKATYLRGGNLGFLAPDGQSNEAGVKVDAALVKAASAVKDGELLAEPVAEGDAFAVIWRRSTVARSLRTLEQAAPQIRTTLYRERTEAAEKQLIDELRAKYVRDVNADLLKIIEIPPGDAGIGLPRSIPQPRPSAPPR